MSIASQCHILFRADGKNQQIINQDFDFRIMQSSIEKVTIHRTCNSRWSV